MSAKATKKPTTPKRSAKVAPKKNLGGRPTGTGRFGGAKTKTMHVPMDLVPLVEALLVNYEDQIRVPLIVKNLLTRGSKIRVQR